MPRIRYIGKESECIGKTVMEIALNLKNFGIGRLITRTLHKQYPETSYYVIKKVEPLMDPENKWGNVWVEQVFRGYWIPGVEILSSSHMPDFQLIPKEDEHLYEKGAKTGEWRQIYAREREFPPLFGRILQKEKGLLQPPKLPVSPPVGNMARLAEEGETPTRFFPTKAKLPPEMLEGIRPI